MKKNSCSTFFYGWIIVAISVTALAVSNGLSIGGFPVFFSSIRKEFLASGAIENGTGESFIAFGATLTFLTAGLISPIAGALIQRYSIRKMMLFGCLLLGSGLLIHSQSHHTYTVYLARILMGASLGFVGVLANSVLVSNWFERKRGIALGIVLTGTSLGGILIPLIAVPLITNYGWRAAMVGLSGIVWFILAPCIFFFVKDRPEEIGEHPDGVASLNAAEREELEHQEDDGITLREAFTRPIFWIFAGCAALIFYPIFVSTQQFILYLQSPKIGLSIAEGGQALAVMAAVSIIGKFSFGALSDHFNPSRIMMVCISFMFVASLVLLNLSASNAYLFLIPMGLGYGGCFVLLQRLVADYFGNKEYAKILGVITVVETVGAAIGGIITGRLADASSGDYTRAFYAVIFVNALTMILVLILNVFASARAFRRY